MVIILVIIRTNKSKFISIYNFFNIKHEIDDIFDYNDRVHLSNYEENIVYLK